MGRTFVHPVQVYYEDTDFSGVVYHANYLKFFERAREHMLGRDALVGLWDEQGIGFVVYRADLKFQEGARFGDDLEIRSSVTMGSAYRAVFDQQVWRPGGAKALVLGEVHLCCIDREQKLVPLPSWVRERIDAG